MNSHLFHQCSFIVESLISNKESSLPRMGEWICIKVKKPQKTPKLEKKLPKKGIFAIIMPKTMTIHCKLSNNLLPIGIFGTVFPYQFGQIAQFFL